MHIHDWDVHNKQDVDNLYEWLLDADTPVKIRINSKKLYYFENQTKKLLWLTGLEAMLNLTLDEPSNSD